MNTTQATSAGLKPDTAAAVLAEDPHAEDPYVLPEGLATAASGRGPRFEQDVWDFSPFVSRASGSLKVDFTRLAEGRQRLAAKQFLYSRLRRPRPVSFRPSTLRKPMKITGVRKDFYVYCLLIEGLAGLGVRRLADARPQHLEELKRLWQRTCSAGTLAARITTVQHIEAHAPFMTADALTFVPWKGRAASQISSHNRREENLTPRIPEQIMGPFLRAAVFYVETASNDILAAKQEVAALQGARAAQRGNHRRGEAAAKVAAFVQRRRAAQRGIPALPLDHLHTWPGASVVDGVVQAPNQRLIHLMCGIGHSKRHLPRLVEAGDELGYEHGGLDTPMADWPDSGRPWRPGLELNSLLDEEHHLRTACWAVAAYLSGMRIGELTELRRDCAVTGTNATGRTVHKLCGRVFKGKQLTGEEADWVVLDIVHRAVEVLLHLNDDDTHLFAYRKRPGGAPVLSSHITERLNGFRDHINELFSAGGQLFVPRDGTQPWDFNSRQLRRTLAWHIAHQPFGTVAGTRQYKHARTSIFEGYAGASASGFAAEVHAEEAIARLDYIEDLYRDWNDGTRSGGGATQRINAEFDRIRRDLGDLPGIVSDATRLRSMLVHLAKTLHPGVLNDCFFHAATAVCVRRAKIIGRPVPQHNMCLHCPNARRSSIHLPRLTAARDQALELHAACQTAGPVPKPQEIAIISYIAELDQIITELDQPSAETRA